MNDLRQYFADNLIFYRKNAGMTQMDLASKIHYSDKAISKWERGESLPDVNTLKTIADLFGISIDALISERKTDTPLPAVLHQVNPSAKKQWIITLLSACLVWMIATMIYSFASMILPLMTSPWQIFIIAIPVSLLVVLVLSCIWFGRKTIFFCASLVLWTTALTLFVMLPITNNWMFFIIPVPVEIIFVLWYTLWYVKEPKE